MQKITSIVLSRPKLFLFMLLLISAAAVWKLGDLRVDANLYGLMNANDPKKALHSSIQKTFGSDKHVVVFVEDKALFDARKLELLQDVTNRLTLIEGVERVISLFTLKNFKRTEQGLDAQLFFQTIPESDAEIKALRDEALRNPFARKLVSSDGMAMAIYVHLRRAGNESSIVQAIEEVILPLKREAVGFDQNALSFERVFQIGEPYLRDALIDTITADQNTLLLLALGVMSIFLVFYLQSFSGLIVPLLIVGLSILWTLGMMAAMDWPITILTMTVPILLLVLGSVKASYLFGQFRAGLQSKKNKSQALLAKADDLGLMFFLSYFTLILGLLAIGLYDIQMLHQFSMIATFALLFHFIITVILTPIYLLAFGSTQDSTESRSLFERTATALAVTIQIDRIKPLVIALMLVLGSGVVWLHFDNEPQAYFDEQEQLQTHNAIMAQRLPGLQPFYIVFSAESDGAFLQPELLNELKKVQDFISQMKLFDASLSVVDLLSVLHREVNGNNPQFFQALPTTAQIQQYLANHLSRSDLEQYVSADFKQALIRVWRQPSGSEAFTLVLDRLQEFTDTLDKRLTVQYNGTNILINDGARSLLSGQAKSLLILLGCFVVLISLLFMSLKAGFIALAPGVLALVVLFGLMGYFELPLNIGTAMVAALTLSITLSHTLCIMIRYNEEMRDGGNEQQAMERALRVELVWIIAASVGLIAGFSVFLAASLEPIIYFGGLMAIMMFMALVINLYVAPKLLTSMRFVTLWGMAKVNVSRKILESCELFKGMHVWQVKQIILLSEVRDVAAGEVFIQQGAVGHEMFLILEGQARVEKVTADKRRQVLYTAHEGDVMGEVALVSQQQRTADVVAESNLKLLVLEWTSLEQLARFLPMISTRLFLNIARIIGRRFGS